MTLWMMWATLCTGLLAAAAFVGERILRAQGREVRWVWVGAGVAAVSLQAWSWLRVTPSTTLQSDGGSVWDLPVPMTEATLSATAWLTSFLSRADDVMLMAWLAGSAVMTSLLAFGLWQLMRRTRRWSSASVRGEDVLLSEGFGPALVGFLSPRIVVPIWALRLEQEQLRMTLLHESEHRAARDNLLLLGGSIAVALTPWNGALWWAVSRLRHAVELDCDTRVLRAGVSRSAYGGLLIDLSSGVHSSLLPVAALGKPASLLERRLKMMMETQSRVGPSSMVGLAVVVGLLAVAACEAPAPSALQGPRSEDSAIQGVEAQSDDVPQSTFAFESRSDEDGTPLIYVDRVRISGATMEYVDRLDPSRIERVEVIKGEAARSLFGESAANGVIQIFTTDAPLEVESPAIRSYNGTERSREDQSPLIGLSVDEQIPTVYIDGNIFSGSLSDLDPDLISRIEVFKDGGERSIHIYMKEG